MEHLSKMIIRFRWVIIIAVVLITAFLGYQIKNIRIDSDVINSLPDTDPHASLLKDIGTRFGGNKIGMVLLRTDDVFQPHIIEHIDQITSLLGDMNGIASVTSLTNIIKISGGDDGLEVGNLIDIYSLPKTEIEFRQLKESVLSDEMYNGFIVSADARTSVIIFTVMDGADVELVAEAVKAGIESLNIPEDIYYAGSPMLVSAISELIAGDLIRLIPISFLVIAFVLFLGFRSKRGIFLPLITSTLAIIWTIGLMGLLGYQMTMISNNIPILLLAIGSAYTIHVINRLAQTRVQDKEKRFITALSYIFLPVLLSGLTTMVGFLSFIFGAYLTMIKEFGLLTAAGTLLSAILSLVFVPAVSAAFRVRKTDLAHDPASIKRIAALSTYLKFLNALLFKHPKYILLAWSVVIVISIGGIFLIERNVNVKDYFRPGNPTRIAEQLMEDDFGGTKPVFVLFTGDMQSPEVLKTMHDCEDYMKRSPDIQSTQSVAGLIAQLYKGLDEGEGIPDERELIEQLWFLIDGNEMLDRLVTPDLDQGIIISKFISSDDESKKAFEEYMNEFVIANSTEDCKIEFTGMPFIDVTMSNSLLRSQISSLSVAIIFVIFIVGLILRSIVKGVLASIPMIAAIFLLFGIMGFSSIPLNIGTVLVASIVLGIGIDYSIHVISDFNFRIRSGKSLNEALEETVLISGKAILINVASVTAGFLVLLFSEMVPLQNFGLLIGLSMIFSSMGALTLLPVILILVNRRRILKE